MTAILTHVRDARAPQAVELAVGLTLLNAIAGIIFSIVWPDLDERATVVTVSIVLGALMVAAAVWLWTGARWGGIATVALNAFNVLLAVPVVFQDDAGVIIVALISVVLSVATIALLFTAEARRYWNHPRMTAPGATGFGTR